MNSDMVATMQPALRIECRTEHVARLFRLLKTFFGCGKDGVVDIVVSENGTGGCMADGKWDSDMVLVTKQGSDGSMSARGLMAACSALKSMGGKANEARAADKGSEPAFAESLFGERKEESEEAQAMAKKRTDILVQQWLLFAVMELQPLLDSKLLQLNSWLMTRTFLVGNSLTMADLVVYAFVSPAVCAFPTAQHDHFSNLLRWYNHVHSLADKDEIFKAASFQKSKLVMPAVIASASGQKKDAGKPKQAEEDTKPKTSQPDNKKASKEERKKAKGEQEATSKKSKSSNQAPATPATSTENADKSKKPAAADGEGPTVDMLDIRIGHILDCKPHPNADALYVEDIDLGEEQPRQVVSGLRKFVPIEAMKDRRVVVVCNLKPAKMRDIMSYGMVLCASNNDHTQVDPIIPPQGVPLGEKVIFEGYEKEPEKQINPKKKIFEKIAPDLTTSADGTCMYRGSPFMTSQGAITATINNAHVA